MPMTEPKAETGSRLESLFVSLEHRCADGRAAWIGVLDDDRRGLGKLLHQLPARVQIDEVVVAEFLALQLRCAGNAES